MGNLIPIVGILFPVFIIFIVFYFVFTTDYKKEKLKREERMKAIEKGIEILPEPLKPPLAPLDYLRRGLIFLAVGLGLILGGWMFAHNMGDPGIFSLPMIGLVLVFIGLALIIYYKIQDKAEK